MSQNTETGKLSTPTAVEMLFNDSSKNFSDLKGREWTATNLSVVAIMGLAAITHGNKDHSSYIAAIVLMFFVCVFHEITLRKCRENLHTFRERIKKLIDSEFPEESHEFFTDKKTFADAVVDEGTIESIMAASTPVTLLFALVYIGLWDVAVSLWKYFGL